MQKAIIEKIIGGSPIFIKNAFKNAKIDTHFDWAMIKVVTEKDLGQVVESDKMVGCKDNNDVLGDKVGYLFYDGTM